MRDDPKKENGCGATGIYRAWMCSNAGRDEITAAQLVENPSAPDASRGEASEGWLVENQVAKIQTA